MNYLEKEVNRRTLLKTSLITAAAFLLGCNGEGGKDLEHNEAQKLGVLEVSPDTFTNISATSLQTEDVGIDRLILYSSSSDSSVWIALLFDKEISPMEKWDANLVGFRTNFNPQDTSKRVEKLENPSSFNTFFSLLAREYPEEIVRKVFFGAVKKPSVNNDYILVYKNNQQEGYLNLKIRFE